MSVRKGALLFLAFALLFFAANRRAYDGYFQDDDINNLSWTSFVPVSTYTIGVLTPKFQPNNFRPVGHFFYYATEHLFGIDFRAYIAGMQIIHLINVWILWLVARRLGASVLAASACCLFFGLHMALFDIFWRPQCIFDLLCGTFSLLTIWLYSEDHGILSLVTFWLAYKSKEIAVTLPVVLLCFELWFGNRRWTRLIPFFLISLSFGLQGLFLNPNSGNDYSFNFSLSALQKTTNYYSGRVFLVPYLGFAIFGALIQRNRRIWFGLAMLSLIFFPLLFLPGRMLPAYCYVPFIGLALMFSGLRAADSPLWMAIFFLAWIPLDWRELRHRRADALHQDAAIQRYVNTVIDFLKTKQPVDVWIWSGRPDGFMPWGIEGALKYFLRTNVLDLRQASDAGVSNGLSGKSVAMLDWHPESSRLEIDVEKR